MAGNQRIWTVESDSGHRLTCDLIHRGAYGVEVRIAHDNNEVLSWRFETRDLAVQWAIEEHAEARQRHAKTH